MTNLRLASAFATVLILGLSGCSQQGTALETPPLDITGMNQQELNEFGVAAATEAYEILSRGGSPTGQMGGNPTDQDERVMADAMALLDDQALIQRSSLNYGISKQTYRPTDIDEFEIERMSLTQPAEDVLVALYDVALPDRTDPATGEVFSGKSMPRLTVLRWSEDDQRWLIFSHADFDTPEATLCGVQTTGGPAKSVYLPEDVALGTQIIDDLVQAKLADDNSVYADGYQIVLASGERNTPSKPIASLTKPVEPSNVEAIRSSDLMAIRYDMPNALNVDGELLAQKFNPRLLTYQVRADGQWELIASAVFGLTQGVADGIDCVPTTANQ
jgi:hypothetical protein